MSNRSNGGRSPPEDSNMTRRYIGPAYERSQRHFGIALSKSHLDNVADSASKFLQSLDFPGMNLRRQAVVAADAKTFHWVFKSTSGVDSSSTSSINRWLSEGDHFYWVSGKAGSGKSTLMNFLISSPETKSALSRWAGNTRVVIISFFFWNSGKALQKRHSRPTSSLRVPNLRGRPDNGECIRERVA